MSDSAFGGRKRPPIVPMNSSEVWILDSVRALNGRDRAALVVWWLFGLVFLAVAIAGSSAVLYFLSAVVLITAVWWTVNRVRAARESAAIQRYADSRPGGGSASE